MIVHPLAIIYMDDSQVPFPNQSSPPGRLQQSLPPHRATVRIKGGNVCEVLALSFSPLYLFVIPGLQLLYQVQAY